MFGGRKFQLHICEMRFAILSCIQSGDFHKGLHLFENAALALGTITRSLRDVLSISNDWVVVRVAEKSLPNVEARSQFVLSENTKKTMTDGDYQSVEPSNSAKPLRLTPPHFDESAVAAAHPVQPLPNERRPRRKRSAFIALAGLLLTVAVVTTLGLLRARSPRSDAVTAPIPDAPSASASQIAQPQAVGSEKSQAVSVGAKPRLLERHGKSRPVRSVVVEQQGKPVARRVGVITYGHSHSPDQP